MQTGKNYAFRALEPDFRGSWPAALSVENADYTGRLFYADPAGTDYRTAKAGGTLSRRHLKLSCKPKDPERNIAISMLAGHVTVSCQTDTSDMLPDEAAALVNDIEEAIASANAAEKFITDLFGPDTGF